MSSELERDGPPTRFMLLGEKLLAFRDSAGRVGVIDHRCPHRCASLFLGRNEQGGLRCIYHGWKFDVSGNCLDMPNVPEDQDFKHKVKAKAYRAVERAGLVWVHMGEGEPPSMPGFEVLDLPPDEINVHMMQRNCNWLQALEGEIDTAHFGFLHGGHVDPKDVPETDPFYFTITNRAPQYHVADAPWGTQYAGYRAAGPGQTYWRFANFLFPCWSQAPNGEFDEPHACPRLGAARRRPHHVRLHLVEEGQVGAGPAAAQVQGRHADRRHRPRRHQDAAQHHGLAGPLAHGQDEGNDWGMDRDAQRRNEIYSGIDGIHLQDQAITESMGPVTDFGHEHLAPSDQMITRTRRRLLLAARALRDNGERPPGADDPGVYRGARSGYFINPDDQRLVAGGLCHDAGHATVHPPADKRQSDLHVALARRRGFRRDIHRHLPVRRAGRAGRDLEGAVDARRPVARHRPGRRGGHAPRGARGRRPAGGADRLFRPRHDGRDQRADPASRREDRPDHHRRLPRPAGDRPPEAARPLRHPGRQAARSWCRATCGWRCPSACATPARSTTPLDEDEDARRRRAP